MTQKDLFLENPIYCFDTSSFILLRQSYPGDMFEPIHSFITTVLRSGKIIVLDLVLAELKQKEKALYDDIKTNTPKERRYKFDDYVLTTQTLIRDYYDGKGRTQRLKADPHIIACAKLESLIVVTEELNSNETKIPYVCEKEDIKYVNFLGFLRKEGFNL